MGTSKCDHKMWIVLLATICIFLRVSYAADGQHQDNLRVSWATEAAALTGSKHVRRAGISTELARQVGFQKHASVYPYMLDIH